MELALNKLSEEKLLGPATMFYTPSFLKHDDQSTPESTKQTIPCKVLRDGQELDLQIAPSPLDGRSVSRIVLWSGAMLQVAHRPVLEKGFVPHTGALTPYCSRWSYGSPAHKYSLRATIWITEVNDRTVDSLDKLLEVVKPIGHHCNVRIRGTDLKGKQKAFTLKTDLNYWPTVDLWRDEEGEWHHHQCQHD